MYIFLIYGKIILGDIMEPYKAKMMPLDYFLSSELIKLLAEANEIYGEYKGYLRNMEYDYKCFIENSFINDLYYSFKIEGSKIEKDDMFHMLYHLKNNESIQFNNLRNCLNIGINELSSGEISINLFNKLNKNLFLNCKKNNSTKGSGKFRKIQNYLLKPGLAGSSVSFIPPVYTEVNDLMKNLISYVNSNNDSNLIATALVHFQFEKIHPYISGNGKIGRLMIPLQYALYKKEPPILFISESLFNLKNTYFTLLSGEVKEDVNAFIKFFLQCVIEQSSLNIKKIKKLNKIYKKDYESFKKNIGGTTIFKIYPTILKKVVFTTNDIVSECNLHINSVNKVLNKLVENGYLIKEKKKGTNRVTFCYKSILEVFTK